VWETDGAAAQKRNGTCVRICVRGNCYLLQLPFEAHQKQVHEPYTKPSARTTACSNLIPANCTRRVRPRDLGKYKIKVQLSPRLTGL
jgi:hypothetical protein